MRLAKCPLGLFLHLVHRPSHLLQIMSPEHLFDSLGWFVHPSGVEMLDGLDGMLLPLRVAASGLPLRFGARLQPPLELLRLLALPCLVQFLDLAPHHFGLIVGAMLLFVLAHFRMESAYLQHQLPRLVSPSLFCGGMCPLFEFLDLAAERIAFFREKGRGEQHRGAQRQEEGKFHGPVKPGRQPKVARHRVAPRAVGHRVGVPKFLSEVRKPDAASWGSTRRTARR